MMARRTNAMQSFDYTYPTPAENLACEEALLEECDAGTRPATLRFWESPHYFVVVGYANKVATEVNLTACRADDLPIHRRCSGGGTVLQGPGCFNYALAMPAPSENVTETNQFIMERNRATLEKLLRQPVAIAGHTDLIVAGQKFSGNAQRRKRRCILFHGTFLLNFDLALIEKYLQMPSKQPDYRQARRHTAFVTNIAVTRDDLKAGIAAAWGATVTQPILPVEIPTARYQSAEWNFKF